MRRGVVFRFFLAAAAALVAAPPVRAVSPTGPLEPVKARLLAETTAIRPDSTLWIDLHLDIAPGWHTYWLNPGDSGLPTEIKWQLPAGFAAGDIVWPVPERFVLGTIGNYGYAGSTDLLVPIKVPKDAQPGTVTLRAEASWLVCSDICIPDEATLTLALPVGAGPATTDPATAAVFATARQLLPQPAVFETRFAVSQGELHLSIPDQVLAGLSKPKAEFFPAQANIVDAAAEPSQQRSAEGLDIVLKRAAGPTALVPEKLDGVLLLRGADGLPHAYEISAGRTALPPIDESAAVAWWQALLLALLGGIALNLMPCVFPVLSLKVLGLAESVHRAEQRRHAGAYAAGVILSFAALGSVLLGLRASGTAVGWGFQLQSPVVVGLLAYLLFALGLSLSGVAEFGAALTGFGDRFARRSGMAGAFATGVLATVVATPCTAPFMGAALGFALLAPTAVALAVFAALGIGLALPLVAVSLVPGIARLLPRPGAWMIWFKQLLAFPLYGTVAWLIWVLIQEVGPGSAFAALLGLVAVAFALWIYGRTRGAGRAGRRLGAGFAAASVAAALTIATTLGATAAPTRSSGLTGARDGLRYEAFSLARLDRLAAEHQPAFVNLTAAWCITCLVNERATLDSAPVRRAFADRHIVALKGDWTRQDPVITAFLQRFGRSGVPLYLLYDKSGVPTVLPQILTEGNVLAALGKI